MNVTLNLTQICLEHVHHCQLKILLLANLFSDFVNGFHVFGFVQIWNVSRIENVVYVLKHLLVDNLGVDKQEACLLVLGTSLKQGFLGIFSPVLHTVTFDDFNLENFVVGNECGETGERLTTTATDTEKETIAERLSNNSGYSTHMITSIQEHDEIHLDLDRTVILLEELFNFLDENLKIFDLLVRSIFTVNTFHVVTEDDSFSIENAFLVKVESLARFFEAEVFEPVSIGIVD